MKYLVIELQTAKDGSVAHLETVYDTKAEAEQKYHQILSYAAVSGETLSCHSAVILTNKGEWYKGEPYDHSEATA